MSDSTIIRFVRNEEMPEKTPNNFNWMKGGSLRWNRIVKFLEANPTTEGWYSIAEFPCDDNDRASAIKAHGDASNVVQHIKGKKNVYVAVRHSRYVFEARATREEHAVVVWARATGLKVEVSDEQADT